MKTIYKYLVSPFDVTEMPRGAEVLSVGAQGDEIVVWAFVSYDDTTKAPMEKVPRRLVAVSTGYVFAKDEDAPKRDQFIGTVQMRDGLVFHIFDLGELL
jgi:hypothetical protein